MIGRVKYAVLLGDGMADRPLAELDGRTPLQAAATPWMDDLARRGEMGLVRTVPPGMTPGSDVANLSVFGYDPKRYFTGRAPLEAASMGIDLGPEDVAFRCNLVTLEEGRMADFSAGHVSSAEAAELIRDLDRALGDSDVSFHAGVSYRHLMVWRNGKDGALCTPPHDIPGQPIRDHLPDREGSAFLKDLMLRAQNLLRDHPVNRERTARGERPANAVWLWGQGRPPRLPSFVEKYGLSGGVVAAVDLVKGIGLYAGLEAAAVAGATGFLDTDYSAKAQAALRILDERDFVYVHVEAPDEAGHMGNAVEKVRAIERFDAEVVGPVREGLEALGPFRLLVLPDHPTPVPLRTHTGDPCPFVLFDSRKGEGNGGTAFDEAAAAATGLRLETGHTVMDRLVRGDEATSWV